MRYFAQQFTFFYSAMFTALFLYNIPVVVDVARLVSLDFHGFPKGR